MTRFSSLLARLDWIDPRFAFLLSVLALAFLRAILAAHFAA